MTWSPDSTRIAYVSERDAVTHVFLYDFTKRKETQLTSDAAPDPMALGQRVIEVVAAKLKGEPVTEPVLVPVAVVSKP